MDYYERVPIPRLIRQGGEKRQQQGFLEPRKPTISGGAGLFHCLLGSAKAVPAEKFGSLAKVYIMPKDRRPGWEKKPRDTNVFVRRDRGPIQYDIWRKDGDRYDDRKFNVLRYPIMGKRNNWEYGKDLPCEAMNDMGRDILYMAQWPYCFGAKTTAPFIWKSGIRHTLDASTLPETLLEVFELTELCELILAELINGWEDVSNLSRTSQRMFSIVGNHFTRLNTRASGFRSLALAVTVGGNLQAPLCRDAEYLAKSDIRTGPFMIVGGIRAGWRNGAEPDAELDYTDVESQVWTYPDEVQYEAGDVRGGMDTYLELLQYMCLKPDVLRHVLLQGVMFLDSHGLGAIIKSLPNLQTIGVHNCELLHFGATRDLIRLIAKENKFRLEKDKPLLQFDFYPRYYQGPRNGSLGCYGVVWSDEGRLDTIKAIVATLISIISLAIQAEVDLLRPGKAFRLWLDKIPFKHRTLPYILDVILRLCDLDKGVFDGSRVYPVNSKDKEAWRRSLWAELSIALNGEAMSQVALDEIFAPRDLTGRCLYKCCECEHELTSNFFVGNGMVDRDDDSRVCHGCQLVAYLNGEGHNYNSLHVKAKAACELWNGGETKYLHELFESREKAKEDSRSEDETDREADPLPIIQARRAAATIERRRQYGIPAQIVKAEAALEELRAQGNNRRYGSNTQTNKLDQAETWIQYLKAELGVAQIAPGTAAQPGKPAAASWEDNVRWYMSAVDMEKGRVVNHGPYAGVVTSELTATQNGTGFCR